MKTVMSMQGTGRTMFSKLSLAQKDMDSMLSAICGSRMVVPRGERGRPVRVLSCRKEFSCKTSNSPYSQYYLPVHCFVVCGSVLCVMNLKSQKVGSSLKLSH